MIWDIDLVKRLQHRERVFDLQVRFTSNAERLVVLGPSGSGKSQTLQMIAGLVKPDSGHVRLLNQTLYDSALNTFTSPQSRQLAYVFQDYALFPHLTVQQNLGFPLRRGWLNPRHGDTREEVERWLKTFDLQAVRHQYPEQLSGGQRQRAALARALVTEPRALLLDEPFAALDKALRLRLRGELKELQARLKIPMVLISHDEDDAMTLADDIVRIEAGEVVPANAFPMAARGGA